jgi:hypothetical protein
MAGLVEVMPVGVRYGLYRDGERLSYTELCSALPMPLWPLPGRSTYAVRPNAVKAAHVLSLRQVPEEAMA